MSNPLHPVGAFGIGLLYYLVRSFRLVGALLKIFWLGFWLSFATLLVTIPIFISTLFSKKGFFAFQMSRVWAAIVLAATGVRVTIRGKEKVKKGQTYIIISNHQSHFDGPAIAQTLGIQFRWVAKKELLNIPVFGHCLHACGNIFIDRSNRAAALRSIQSGIESLPKGVGVMFFAEGTRSANGRLGRFKKGGFSAALQTGLPILPITVNGSARALPKKSVVFSSSPIEVIVGDPIEVTGYTHQQIDDLMEKTRDIISANLIL